MTLSPKLQHLLRFPRNIFFAFILVVFIALPVAATAQSPQKPAAEASLRQTVQSLDTRLFDAYNQCDIPALSSLVSDDLEFYHDKTGLSVGKAKFLSNTKQYICGKVQRTLVASSLEVYPLEGYGAVEMGVHRFHHPDQSADDVAGEAKFVMLWQNTNGVWKLARVISYDHESLAK
jgi:ketosteroid isomerase-like protein